MMDITFKKYKPYKRMIQMYVDSSQMYVEKEKVTK